MDDLIDWLGDLRKLFVELDVEQRENTEGIYISESEAKLTKDKPDALHPWHLLPTKKKETLE